MTIKLNPLAPEGAALPKIYIASLSDYNAGRLHGAWHTVTDDPAETWAEIIKVLTTSQETNAEEWEIHDHEGWGVLNPEQYTIEHLSELAAGVAEHGPAFFAWINSEGDDALEELDSFEEAYCGAWESLVAYAENLLEEIGIYHDLEKHLGQMAQYCQPDLEQFAHDLRVGSDNYTADNPDGGVWVFRSVLW